MFIIFMVEKKMKQEHRESDILLQRILLLIFTAEMNWLTTERKQGEYIFKIFKCLMNTSV